MRYTSTRRSDLGAHIDGFIATAAHSVVVPAEDGSVANITGPAADVVVAAYNAAQIAARLIKPGAKVWSPANTASRC